MTPLFLCGIAFTNSWQKQPCVNKDGINGRTKLEIMSAAACEIRVKKTEFWSFLRIVSVADSITCLFSTRLRGSNPTLSAIFFSNLSLTWVQPEPTWPKLHAGTHWPCMRR